MLRYVLSINQHFLSFYSSQPADAPATGDAPAAAAAAYAPTAAAYAPTAATTNPLPHISL